MRLPIILALLLSLAAPAAASAAPPWSEPAKKPVLAAEGDRADDALCGVVVDLDTAVVEVSAERRQAGESA